MLIGEPNGIEMNFSFARPSTGFMHVNDAIRMTALEAAAPRGPCAATPSSTGTSS